MQKDPVSGWRLDEQLMGTIRPGSGSLAGRYEIFSTDPTIPVELPPGATGWSGMSGAALLCEPRHDGGLLCGVVRQDRQATGGTRLTATPISVLLEDNSFRALITEHCSWEPVLEPAEPAGILASAVRERDLRSPAMLLRAEAEAVTFHGREQELDQLLEWCHQGHNDLSLRVLIGPGGQGKTRLARHLCDTLRHQKWIAGHLRTDLPDDSVSPDLSVLDTAYPLLLVVDYAETRPRLLRHLLERLRTKRYRTRLLLLARSDGEWRTDTLSATARARELLRTAPVIELAPLIPRSAPSQTRARAFTRAAVDIARLLERVAAVPGHSEADWPTLAAALRPPEDLSEPRYDSVLTLQMTALTALLQLGPAPTSSIPGEPAEATLLSHEQRYWEETAQTPAFRLGDLRTITLRRAVAIAALCGATDQDEAEATARKVPGLPPNKALDIAEWIRSLYPPGPNRYWGSLQPDRLAEYHASDVVAQSGALLISLMEGSSPAQQTQIIIVLARAAVAHYNAGRAGDSNRVLQALSAALDSSAPHPRALSNAVVSLPRPNGVLIKLALRLCNDLARLYGRLAATDPAAYEPELAKAQINLGVSLSLAGRQEEGVVSSEQAVEIYRRLAEADPDAFGPALATALSMRAWCLSEAGRWEEALVPSAEAVERFRRLAEADPGAYEPDLAKALFNRCAGLNGAGRSQEALGAAIQSRKIYRHLAETDPAGYEPGLAQSLSNLGVVLGNARMAKEGAASSRRAVEIYRRLAAADPDAYEVDLGIALCNLGGLLSATGRQEEATLISGQAVEIFRTLAAVNPSTHQSNLLKALRVLEWVQSSG